MESIIVSFSIIIVGAIGFAIAASDTFTILWYQWRYRKHSKYIFTTMGKKHEAILIQRYGDSPNVKIVYFQTGRSPRIIILDENFEKLEKITKVEQWHDEIDT